MRNGISYDVAFHTGAVDHLVGTLLLGGVSAREPRVVMETSCALCAFFFDQPSNYFPHYFLSADVYPH